MAHRPTDEQINFFREHGITPPASRYTCDTLIAFIRKAKNGSDNEDAIKQKVAELKAIEDKFVGKTVRGSRTNEFMGVVSNLFVDNWNRVKLMVRWNDGKTFAIFLSQAILDK